MNFTEKELLAWREVTDLWLSKYIRPLSYRQIPTLKYYYRFTFFPKSIIHRNALPAHIPVLPTLAQFSSAVCQVIHVSPYTPVSVFTF